MEDDASPDAEFIRDLQDFFLPYSTADADQDVVLDLTLQYFTLLRICYKITQVVVLLVHPKIFPCVYIVLSLNISLCFSKVRESMMSLQIM